MTNGRMQHLVTQLDQLNTMPVMKINEVIVIQWKGVESRLILQRVAPRFAKMRHTLLKRHPSQFEFLLLEIFSALNETLTVQGMPTQRTVLSPHGSLLQLKLLPIYKVGNLL